MLPKVDKLSNHVCLKAILAGYVLFCGLVWGGGITFDGITGYRPVPSALPVVIVDDNPGEAKYYNNENYVRAMGGVTSRLQPMRQYLVTPSAMAEYKRNVGKTYSTSCGTNICSGGLSAVTEKVVSTAIERDGYFLMFLFALELDNYNKLVTPADGILNTSESGEDIFVRLRDVQGGSVKFDYDETEYIPVTEEFTFKRYGSNVYRDAWKGYLNSVGFKYDSFVFVRNGKNNKISPAVVVKVGSGQVTKKSYAMYGTWNDDDVAKKYISSLGTQFKKGDKVYFSEWMLLPELTFPVVDSFQIMVAQQQPGGAFTREYRYGRYCFTENEAKQNLEKLAWRDIPYWDGKMNRTLLDTVNFVYDNLVNFSGDIYNFVLTKPNRNTVTRMQLLNLFNGADARSTDTMAIPYAVVPSPDDVEHNMNAGLAKDFPDMFWYFELFKQAYMEDMKEDALEPKRAASSFLDIESYFKDQVIGVDYDKTIYNQPYNINNLGDYVRDPHKSSGYDVGASLNIDNPMVQQRIYDQSNPKKMLNAKMMLENPIGESSSYNVIGHAAIRPEIALDENNNKIKKDSTRVLVCNGREYCWMCKDYVKYGEHKINKIGNRSYLHGVLTYIRTTTSSYSGRGGRQTTVHYNPTYVNGYKFEATEEMTANEQLDSVWYTQPKANVSKIDTLSCNTFTSSSTEELSQLNYSKNVGAIDTIVSSPAMVTGVKKYVNYQRKDDGFEEWHWYSYFPVGTWRTGDDGWFNINGPYDPPYISTYRQDGEIGSVTTAVKQVLNKVFDMYNSFAKDFVADTSLGFERNVAKLRNAGYGLEFIGTGMHIKDGSVNYFDSAWYFGNRLNYFAPFVDSLDFVIHNDYYEDDNNFLKIWMTAKTTTDVISDVQAMFSKDAYWFINQKMYLTFRWPLVYIDVTGAAWVIGYAQMESDICIFDADNTEMTINGDDFWLWDAPLRGSGKFDARGLQWEPYREGGSLIYVDNNDGDIMAMHNERMRKDIPKWKNKGYKMLGTLALCQGQNVAYTTAKYEFYGYEEAYCGYPGCKTNEYLTILPLRGGTNKNVRYQIEEGYPLRDWLTDAWSPEDRNDPNSWPSEIEKKMMYEIALLIGVGEGVNLGMKGLHWLATDGVTKYPYLSVIAAACYKTGQAIENNKVVKWTCKWAKTGWKVYKEFQETLDLINAVDESWQKVGKLWTGMTEAAVNVWNYYKDTDFSDLSLKNISKLLPFRAMYKFDAELRSFQSAVIDFNRAMNDLAIHADSAYISDAVVAAKRMYEAVLFENGVEVEFERRKIAYQKRAADSISYKDKNVATQKYASNITNFLVLTSQEVKLKSMTNGLKTVENIATMVEGEAKDWDAFGQYTAKVFSKETGNAIKNSFGGGGLGLTMYPLMGQLGNSPAVFQQNLDVRRTLRKGDFWASPEAWNFVEVDSAIHAKRTARR